MLERVWRKGNSPTLLVCVLIAQLCLTLCNPMDCSPPGSPVHGILQSRILGQVAISSSRGSSWLRDWTCVSHIDRWIFYPWATRETLYCLPVSAYKTANYFLSSSLSWITFTNRANSSESTFLTFHFPVMPVEPTMMESAPQVSASDPFVKCFAM